MRRNRLYNQSYLEELLLLKSLETKIVCACFDEVRHKADKTNPVYFLVGTALKRNRDQYDEVEQEYIRRFQKG